MEKSISSDLIRGHIDTIILHTLLSGDKFAQQISDEIELKSNNEYQINQATLYSSLKRLETQKYIIGYWHDTESGRRKNFKITDAGSKFVDDNLSNWSYSKAIIDKLMDFTPEPVYQTKYIEKIVEVPVTKITQEKADNPIENNATKKPLIEDIKPKNEEISENKDISADNSDKSSNSDITKEINFRNILNGLIKTSNLKKSAEPENLEPIKNNKSENEPAVLEDLSFNESISSPDFTKVHNIKSQIDFGDLSLKAKEEGFKLRISSKDTKVTGSILENKVNFISALIILALTLIEFGIFALSSGSLLKIDALKSSLTIIALLIFPTVMAIIYFRNPSKTCKEIKGDSILVALVVVFNLVLFTFVFDLLLSVKLSDAYSLLIAFIIPMVLYIDALIFYVLRFYLSKNKKFKLKNN